MYIGKRFILFGFHHTKYCIIGGGTGGLNTASHLLRSDIKPTDIRIFEPAQYHYYQPGWTMIGFNMVEPQVSFKRMEDVIPQQSHWTKQKIVKIDPTKNLLLTDKGHQFHYDHLIISTGYKNDWHKIQGAKQLLDDPKSNVSSIYDFEYSKKTGKLGQRLKKGKAIFTQPMMPIKCAGAPQKILYLWSNEWRDRKLPIDIQYIKTGAVMFGVPKYSQTLKQVAKNYNVNVTFKHNLVKVTKDKAIFENLDTKQKIQKPYDFLHLVPPMSPHEFLKQSGLTNEAGFVDVDKHTCRHTKFPNVWALGDCSSLPCSKTAAAIFSQTIALTNNLIEVEKNPNLKQLPNKYDGYASCPLFTGDKHLMLAQFKYDGQISQTFLTDQEKPRRIFYYLKKYFFPLAYWQLVPKGLWNGRKGIRWI